MSLIRPYLWIALMSAACQAERAAPIPDGSTPTPDFASAADGGAGDGATCSIATSPSGYACDPWSAHLYIFEGAKRQGTTLRLTAQHDPDNEGSQTDMTVPPGHQFYQTLTVDVPLTPEVKQFLCVVFAVDASRPSFDASSATFLSDVNYSQTMTLLYDGVALPTTTANLVDLCGTTLPAVVAPTFTQLGKPQLPDLALMLPLDPAPTGFTAGQTIHGWLGRGVLYVDEQSELAPAITATVVSVQ
jgi:hypothetical protein